MESHKYLKQARTDLIALRKILKDADPASGISFAVRRGIARDNDEIEGDSEKRPWVTIETSWLGLAGEAIAKLIQATQTNIDFWEKATKRDIEEAQKILDEK